jgi:hypothetical protein
MLDLVLENNHFSFNGKNYIQTEGTAIGSHLGMNYACTYLGEWEQELFEKSDRLILTSKNSICCEEKRNSVLMRG